MADITVSYKGSSIATINSSGTTTLGTSGKYCEDDITINYVKPSGGSSRISFTESPGYINADGTIHTPDSTRKEKYTSLIPATSASELLFYLKNATTVGMWACVCPYDSNGDFIQRTQLVNSNRASFYTMLSIPSTAAYIRLTYRTYGTMERYVYDLTV